MRKSNKICVQKGYILSPAKCACKNGKYLGSIIDNPIICDKIIETTNTILTKTISTKIIPTNFNREM